MSHTEVKHFGQLLLFRKEDEVTECKLYFSFKEKIYYNFVSRVNNVHQQQLW